MTMNKIIQMLKERSDRRVRAERLQHAELRARNLAMDRKLELSRTPLDLATPGSLDRYLNALSRLGDSACHLTVRANSFREQRDRLLLGRL